jgi:hypothetical protein
VAAKFGLGAVLAHDGPTGRGQAGFVVRFTTSTGLWAVKQLIEPQDEDEVREDVDLVAEANLPCRVAHAPVLSQPSVGRCRRTA